VPVANLNLTSVPACALFQLKANITATRCEAGAMCEKISVRA
jgi:hypothetical protein